MSLDKFGDLSGFVFNQRTGNLISGHQRQKVLPKNSAIHIEISHLSPTACMTIAEGYVLIGDERFKYREVDADEEWEMEALLAANKHGGEWDSDALKSIEIDFPEMDFKIAGFDSINLSDEAYAASTPKTTEEIPVEDIDGIAKTEQVKIEDSEPAYQITKEVSLGDIWTLGEHRLLCGDSLDRAAWSRLIGLEEIDLVYTDPPYGISLNYGKDSGSGVTAKGSYKAIAGDESIEVAEKVWCLIQELKPKQIVIWGANYFTDFLPPSRCWLCWYKKEDVPSDDFADCELAYCSEPKNAKVISVLWKGMIKEGEWGKRIHPTQKPIMLATETFEYLKSGQTVLDVFGGSGSTLMACERTGRKCFMIEIDPDYVSLIIARWEAVSGKIAVKIS